MRTWIVYKEQCRGFTLSIINIPEKDEENDEKTEWEENQEMTQWDLTVIQLNWFANNLWATLAFATFEIARFSFWSGGKKNPKDF